jgi:hypothetical protein
MGWHVEVNTVLRLGSDDVDTKKLKAGDKFNVKRQNVRIYLIDIPILLLTEDWKVIGYCAVRKSTIEGKEMLLEVEIVTLFSEKDSKSHTEQFKKALKKTGYLK